MANWNISAGAIRNPIPPIVLILGLVFAGFTAYERLPVNQIPNVEFPEFDVGVGQPGAAPVEMESQIAQKVEAALQSVTGVRRVTTSISPGYSNTNVELQIGADTNRAVEDARDAMARLRPDLPADITEPSIRRHDTAAQPIGYYALEAQGMSDEERSWFIDNELSRELLSVPGVSQVRRNGGVDREIRVELSPERLTAYGVSADSISRQLRALNADFAGGQAEVAGQAQTIRTLGSAASVETLSETRITAADGRSVRLGDLGVVRDSASELSQISRFNNQPVVAFAIQRAKNASEVKVFDGADKKLKELEAKHPGMHFRLLFTSVDFIRGMHESSISALIEGAFLACLVVFLVLRDWRSTLIAAAAIPLSVIPTFAVIELLGFTINMMTLIALALVAGVLVDDAIVEIENIVRHMRMGKKPYEAALEAADEIGLAVVATSAAIIAVFMPVGFMSGRIGVWFREFGITVAVATFFSLVVARLITPMMAAYFLKDHGHEEKHGDWMAIYARLLRFALRRPAITVASGVVATIIAFVAMMPFMQFTFIPRFDNGTVQANVEIPPGTTMAEADRAVQAIGARTTQLPEVKDVFYFLNGSQGAATGAQLFISLTDRSERKRSSYQVQLALRPLVSGIPDYRVSMVNDDGGAQGADITVQFVGQDPHAVNNAAERLVAAMRKMPELADARSSAALQRPELQIRPRDADMARLGVTGADLSAAVRIATSGDVEQNLPRFDLPDRQIPIRVMLREDARANIDVISGLPVQSANGPPVRLDAVADLSFGFGEVSVERRDRERSVTVYANVAKGDIGSAQRAIFALPEAKDPGPGVRLATAGDTEQMADMMSAFSSALLWGLILIYAVLVLLFRDFYHPITIMLALPLSIGGALGGLLIANQPISLFVLIGLIMLMGIVTKNSILLVDFAIEQMHKGMDRTQALLEAGLKRSRPIVMTTFAMAAGMVPAAAGWSVDGTLRQGMGAAVMGGLLISTLLSLIYVPAFFILIDRLEHFLQKVFSFGRKRAPEPHAQAAE